MDDIPEDVKEQALQVPDAVQEDTRMRESAGDAAPGQSTPNSDLPDDVKKQSLQVTEAIRDNTRMVEHTGHSISAQNTPNPELSEKVGKELNDMQRAGYDADKIHQELTKDDFVKE